MLQRAARLIKFDRRAKCRFHVWFPVVAPVRKSSCIIVLVCSKETKAQEQDAVSNNSKDNADPEENYLLKAVDGRGEMTGVGA